VNVIATADSPIKGPASIFVG